MSRHVTQMSIDDAAHFTEEQHAEIIASYPDYEREARVKGVPVLGSGRVFPVTEESFVIDAVPIPTHWPQINGLDFGWDHPFAAVNIAWDRDADCVYVTREYAAREETPPVHASAIRAWGDWVPCAWPQDGLQHDKGSGRALAEQYRAQGLNMTPERAAFADGSVGLEAGIYDMLTRMKTGRWKVFRSCGGWLEEFRLYHRKDGVIVKERDDRISASRYALMLLRFATVKPVGGWATPDHKWVV
jgi:hypothetical protein